MGFLKNMSALKYPSIKLNSLLVQKRFEKTFRTIIWNDHYLRLWRDLLEAITNLLLRAQILLDGILKCNSRGKESRPDLRQIEFLCFDRALEDRFWDFQVQKDHVQKVKSRRTKFTRVKSRGQSPGGKVQGDQVKEV